MKRPRILFPAILLLAAPFCPAQTSAPDTYSPVVSYQYQDSLDEPGTSTTVSSLVVSYQFQESLDEPGTVLTVGSPVVSYQYFEYATGEVSLINSANVSLFFNDFPQILTPPASQAVLVGASANFTVAASGAPAPNYQWQVSMDGGITWINVGGSGYAGATTATLTITNPSTTLLGYQYRAVVTNAAATINTPSAPLVVGTSSTKLAWLQNYFTTTQLGQPAIVGDTAEPIGDGIPNLLKYAFNLNPWENGQPLLPQATPAAGNLVLNFPTPQTDLTYTVQASTDLVNWSTNGVVQTNGPQATATYPISPSSPVFLRIMVSPAP
jgi:hypothetical protein